LLLFLYASILVSTRNINAVRAKELSLLVGLVLGIISDITVLAAVRFSVRLIATSARLRDIVLAILVQLTALTLIVVVPFELLDPLLAANKDSLVAVVLMSTTLFNLFTALGVSAFVVLLVIVTLHRVSWPMLGRVVYSIARFKPLQNNRQTFALIGIMCVMYGFGVLSWQGLIVWFAKRFAP
jgi:hypothetical protein